MPFPILPLLAKGAIALGTSIFAKKIGSAIDRSNSKNLMNYQGQLQLANQAKMNAMLYPQQVASMRMAGLNPALMSAPMSASASMPSATQSSSGLDIQGAAQSMKELELLDAQKDNIEADTKEKQAKTAESWANTDLLDQSVLTGLQTWAKDMEEKQSRIDVNNAQVKQFEQSVKTLAAQEDELVSKIDLNKSFLKLNNKQIESFDDMMRATIREKLANANFLNANAKSELELLLYKQFNYSAMTRMYNSSVGVNNSQAALNNSQKGLVEVNQKAQEITNKYNLRYGDVERVVGIVTDVVGTAAQCTSAGGLLMMGLNSSKPKFGQGQKWQFNMN